MAVYVDNMRARRGWLIFCHMVADSLPELHAMADRISLPRIWFQDHPRHPHYDVCLGKRAEAVRAGAIEVDTRELVAIIHTASIIHSARRKDQHEKV